MALFLGGCFCGGGPGQTEASLYVSDAATGKPVRNPSFTAADGSPISARCQPDPYDSGLCESELLVLAPGAHTINVSAPGYQSASVSVDTSNNDSLHLSVVLRAQP
jgi:hypothetical protein